MESLNLGRYYKSKITTNIYTENRKHVLMIKKVVILGSKPDAIIPEGDIIYCANASLSLYPKKARKFNDIIVVGINPLFKSMHKNRNMEHEEKDFNIQSWNMLVRYPAKIVIVGDKKTETTIQELMHDGFSGRIDHMTKPERRKLIGKVSGCYDPIITNDFWSIPLSYKLEYNNSIITTITKRTFGIKASANCMLRPSTGIFSLVYAIKEHGSSAEYVVSGIGITNRGVYSGRKNKDKDKKHPFSHIFADQKVLKELAKSHRISTTEQSLMHILPAFKGWNQ